MVNGDGLALKNLIVLVTGGRTYADRTFVFHVLDTWHKACVIELIIHGACCEKGRPTELRGADRWAQEWAQTQQVAYIGVPAEWEIYGRSAGFKRNLKMRDKWRPDYVIAFPGGDGTKSMMTLADAMDIEVRKAGW